MSFLRMISFVQSSGCQSRPPETSAYRPRLSCWWYKSEMDASSESMVQIKHKMGTNVAVLRFVRALSDIGSNRWEGPVLDLGDYNHPEKTAPFDRTPR